MTIELPRLPYSKDALDPFISAETLDFHHDKHHRAYVDKTNALIKGTPDATKSLEEIIAGATGPLFNNAAQAWNHSFYWNSMSPEGGGEPTGALAKSIERNFKSFDAFREEFLHAATSHFGSGWAWLVRDADELRITTTADADLPSRYGLVALLACDLWEHAYYLDYRNERPKYVAAFLDHLLNWKWVEQNLESKSATPRRAATSRVPNRLRVRASASK